MAGSAKPRHGSISSTRRACIGSSCPPSPTTTKHSLPGGPLRPYLGRTFTGWIAPAWPGARTFRPGRTMSSKATVFKELVRQFDRKQISTRNRASRPSTSKSAVANPRAAKQQIAKASSALILFESIQKNRGSRRAPSLPLHQGVEPASGCHRSKILCESSGGSSRYRSRWSSNRRPCGRARHWPRVSAGCQSRPRRSPCCCCRSE